MKLMKLIFQSERKESRKEGYNKNNNEGGFYSIKYSPKKPKSKEKK
jgi:hypothetical protein